MNKPMIVFSLFAACAPLGAAENLAAYFAPRDDVKTYVMSSKRKDLHGKKSTVTTQYIDEQTFSFVTANADGSEHKDIFKIKEGRIDLAAYTDKNGKTTEYQEGSYVKLKGDGQEWQGKLNALNKVVDTQAAVTKQPFTVNGKTYKDCLILEQKAKRLGQSIKIITVYAKNVGSVWAETLLNNKPLVTMVLEELAAVK